MFPCKLFRLMDPKTLMLQTLLECQSCYDSCFKISSVRNKSCSFVQIKLCGDNSSLLPPRVEDWTCMHFSTSCCVLTENCTVFARLHGILQVLLPEWWAPSLQSQYTKINKQTQININKYYIKYKHSHVTEGKFKKNTFNLKFLNTLTCSLRLMARAECSSALMTEV